MRNTCVVCTVEFETTRPATTCGARHRNALARLRRRDLDERIRDDARSGLQGDPVALARALSAVLTREPSRR